MKKTFISALLFFFFTANPINAQPVHDLAELPKDVLVQGLQTSAVCMIIEAYGIKRMLDFYETNKGDDGAADKAATAAALLYDDFQMEKTLSIGIIKTFKTHYHMTPEEIGKIAGEEIDAAEATMKNKYDTLDDYDGFSTAYQNSLDTCTKAIEAFGKRVESEFDDIDKNKTNP